MSEIPKWQASIQYLYPGEATSGRMAVYLADDVDAAIAAAEQRAVDEFRAAMSEGTWYRAGYEAALVAAREAVAGLPSWNYTYGSNPPFVEGPPVFGTWMVKAHALAAIDALAKGERA